LKTRLDNLIDVDGHVIISEYSFVSTLRQDKIVQVDDLGEVITQMCKVDTPGYLLMGFQTGAISLFKLAASKLTRL
jgi:hypothetical protein